MIETNVILDFILLVISALILREYLNSFFEYNNSSALLNKLYWFLYVALQIAIDGFYPENPYTNLAVHIIFILLICILAYSGKIYKKAIYSFLYLVIWMLVEVLLNYTFPFFDIDASNYFLFGAIFSKLLLLIIIRVIGVYVKSKKSIEIPIKYWIVMLMIPIFSLVVVIGIYTIVRYEQGTRVSFVFLITSVMMLFINFIIYIIYDKIMDGMVIERQNCLYEQQLNLCSKQVTEREEAMLDIRKIRHDMKNHLIYLREITDLNEKKKMIEYLDNLINVINLEKTGISRSSNVVIDALVNYKYSIAQKEGIDFQINIVVPYKLPYDDGDICIILGNALDNAIEASTKLPIGERYIRLAIGAKKNALSIVVKNRYNGVLKKDHNMNYHTNKKDSINHGIGLMSISKAVEKYNGIFEINDKENEFSLTILLYAKV